METESQKTHRSTQPLPCSPLPRCPTRCRQVGARPQEFFGLRHQRLVSRGELIQRALLRSFTVCNLLFPGNRLLPKLQFRLQLCPCLPFLLDCFLELCNRVTYLGPQGVVDGNLVIHILKSLFRMPYVDRVTKHERFTTTVGGSNSKYEKRRQ